MTTLENGLFNNYSLNFDTLAFSYFLGQIKPEGNIVYEYNPLHNYRLTKKSGNLPKGTITDLDTDELTFDLSHPVNMEL